jgi:predicted nuclease of predicted toxin-antitoxin system
MTYKLLIDECLSPALARLAIEAGHVESTCVRDRGWLGIKDWQLAAFAVAGDYTLVTHNAVDFRGKGSGDQGGHYATLAIHAGLICFNSPYAMTPNRQKTLFQHVLTQLAQRADLVNTALEVFEAEDDAVTIEVYDIPRH